MSFFNFDFMRFDRNSDVNGFVYTTNDNPKELEHDFNSISMDKAGFVIHTVVQNYMAEPVLLGGNLRVSPTRIQSLRQGNMRARADNTNSVLITIYSSENNHSPDPKKRTTHSKKTEIRIPGKMLNQGSVFISELDCYLTVESQIEATKELIARDVAHKNWTSINVPSSMMRQDPSIIYCEHKQLVQYCIERQDKINIRVGVDLEYGDVPDIVKTMHVSIVDSYFVPFSCYKLVYDPALGEDEFVIENLHLASQDVFRWTFSELSKNGVKYLDYNEIDTMFGKFHGLAIFADGARYSDYVYDRKTQERFEDETLYVANRSGDPRLREEIAKLNKDNESLREIRGDHEATIASLRDTNKKLKADVRDREETISKITQHHDAKMSSEAVMADIQNEQMKLENDRHRIHNDAADIHFKEKAAPLNHKASMLKTISDMLKSTWGIITASLGAILSIAALCKKYNVKLSMGT